ncbi:MAG: peptidoglycan-binding protein [Treponema sp.]|jgi:hypothetical protein|nr:peptidoglycan-binding protein [Treponema sp.]
MNCKNAADRIYEIDDPALKEPGILRRFSLALHILFCSRCAVRLEHYEEARFLLGTSFFPPSPDFESALMSRICSEEEAGQIFDTPGGFSTKGWVIVGLIVLLSLSSLFFGKDFASVALDQGSSFLLPLGITIGIFLTGYGALFIGSHLKELSERFKL